MNSYLEILYRLRFNSYSRRLIVQESLMLTVVNKSIVMLLYLQTPKSEEEWQAIAKNFVEKWQFPHCLGALDGKHIYIQPPVGVCGTIIKAEFQSS